jgi:hypothetical protein
MRQIGVKSTFGWIGRHDKLYWIRPFLLIGSWGSYNHDGYTGCIMAGKADNMVQDTDRLWPPRSKFLTFRRNWDFHK